MNTADKQIIEKVHTTISRIAAEIDGNRPGPFQLGAVAEALRTAVAPLEPLVNPGSDDKKADGGEEGKN